MADLFGNNNDNNPRDDGRPSIVFSNMRVSNQPILSEAGYRVFSASSTFAWFMLAFFVWVFDFEVIPSKEVISQIAGSSVELSALAIAVLTILLEVNKADKWFKLGLLLVATLFVSVVLGGFYLVLTWQETFGIPQQVTVVVVGLLGIAVVFQVQWKGFLRFLRLHKILNRVTSPRLSKWLPNIRISIQFVIPILLIWSPNLNRVTSVIILFIGSIISLIILMLVTTVSVLRAKPTVPEEDQFIQVLRTRYETDIKVLIRIGEIKVAIVEALKGLQEAEKNAALKRDSRFYENAPNLIAWADLKIRLRGNGLVDNDKFFDKALDLLVAEAKLYREGYPAKVWLVPTESEIKECARSLMRLSIVLSQPCGYSDKHNPALCFENMRFNRLAIWLSKEQRLPLPVVVEYAMPRMIRILFDENYYHKYEVVKPTYPNEGTTSYLFINQSWKLTPDEWNSYVGLAKADAKEKQNKAPSDWYDRIHFDFDVAFSEALINGLLENVTYTDDHEDNYEALVDTLRSYIVG